MTDRRPRFLAVLLTAATVVALGGCRPQDLPISFDPPPAGAVISVPSATVARGSSFEVSVTGCDDDFQDVELRLVVGLDAEPRSATVTWAGGGAADPVVPMWAPSGPARLEASCLEANMSHAADSPYFKRFDYQPVTVSVAGAPAPVPSAITVPDVVTDGVLRVSGSGCTGPVHLSISQGRSLVAASDRFRYGGGSAEPAADGTWSASLELRYSVSEFSDPVAPGPMSVFGRCDGRWFPAETFEVAVTRPSVHVVNPSLLYLSQCPPENTLGILGVVTLGNGDTEIVAHNGPGLGYGERFQHLPLPPGTTEVTWHAGCNGDYSPRFNYVATTWSA